MRSGALSTAITFVVGGAGGGGGKGGGGRGIGRGIVDAPTHPSLFVFSPAIPDTAIQHGTLALHNVKLLKTVRAVHVEYVQQPKARSLTICALAYEARR